MNRLPSAHPPPEQLRAFAEGRVGPGETDVIEGHLRDCPTCCEALESTPDDALVSLIRSAGRSTYPGAARAVVPTTHAPRPAPARPAVPGYEVLRELGRGGMGVVYLARQLGLGRPVALKMLLAGAHADVAQLARFRTEGEAIARLRHTNIVQIHDTGVHDGLPYFALEYVEGGSLADRVGSAPQPPREAAALVEVVARAVEAAHREGIIHRDLKPANILLARDPCANGGAPGLAGFVPKVTDFGLAKWVEQGEGLTQTGTLAGTPAYMAPEQAAGRHREVGPATDVYALGAILYEMLTGRPPFQGGSVLETLDQVRNAEPVPPRRLLPRLPRDLETICLKCLEKEPAKRYPSARALADDLGRFGRGEPIRARPVGPAGRAWKWARRHPALASLLALVAFTVLAGSATSTYYGVEASRRAAEAEAAKGSALALADEKQQALDQARHARRESDRRAAALTFREGLAECESGEVAKGMFTLLDAWEMAPEDDVEFRRVVRTNLAAWRWQLPVLRGVVTHGRGGPIWLALLGPEGKAFATRGDQYVQVWDTQTAAPVGPPSVARKGESIRAVTPDGTVFGRRPDGRYFFRPLNGKTADDQLLPAWVGAIEDVRPERKGPGATGLLVRGPLPESRFVAFWHLERRRKDPVLVPHTNDMFYYVTRDRGGREVLAVFRSDRGRTGSTPRAEFWDLGTGRRLPGFTPPRGGEGPWVSWDGRTILSVSSFKGFRYSVVGGGVDGSVRWWDPGTGRPVGAPWQPRRPAWFSELSGDGSVLASWGRDNRVRLYELATGLQRGGDVVLDVADRASPFPVFFPTPDGATVLATGRTRTACLWETRHLRPQASLAASPRSPPARLNDPFPAARAAFSPDGRAALVCSRPDSDAGWLTDVRRGLPRGRPLRHSHLFNPTFSPDGKLVVTLSHNHAFGGEPVARVWDASTGEPRTPPLLNPKYLHGAAFSPDGKTLALGGPGGAWLWDVPGARLRAALPEATAASQLAFSPDGRYLATGCRAGWPGVGAGVRLWHGPTGRPVGEFVSTKGDVNWLTFADGGRALLAFTGAGELYRLDTRTGRPRGQPLLLPRQTGAAFSADGSRLATVDLGGAVRQWETATGRPVGPPMVPPHRTVSLRYGPDGGCLATLCEDEGVRLWDSRTGLPLGPPLLHSSLVLAVSFSPDGRSVLTATDGGRTHVWPVPEPVADDRERMTRWLQVASGMVRRDGEVELQDAETWRRRREEFSRRWPDPDPALAISSGPGEWHDRRARDAEEDGSTTAALRHLDSLIGLRPREWSGYARKGRAYAQAGALDLAAKAYDRAEAVGRGEVRDWYRHRAAALRLAERWESALWYQERLVKSGADDWQAYADRAELYGRLGRTAEQEADLGRAAARDPTPEFLARLAQRKAEQGAWEEAVRLYARAAGRGELPVAEVHRQALACLKAGEVAVYRQLCARLVASAADLGPWPAYHAAAPLAGVCVLGPDALADWGSALGLVEKGLTDLAELEKTPDLRERYRPTRYALLSARGAVLYRAGRYREAADALKAAVGVHGGGGTTRDGVFLALAHHRLKDARGAAGWLKKAEGAGPPGRGFSWEALERELLLREARSLLGPGPRPTLGRGK
jgi:eukaryotic-like serine/threonine-protein kinase